MYKSAADSFNLPIVQKSVVTVPDFQAAFQVFPAICMLADTNFPDYTILEYNKACAALPGFPAGKSELRLPDVLEHSLYLCGEGPSCIREYAQALLEGRLEDPKPIRYHSQHEQKCWDLNLTPVPGPDGGRPGYLMITLLEVTQELQISEQIAAYDQRLRIVYQLARMGYWSRVIGEDTVQWSSEMFELFGQSPATFITRLSDITSCFHPDDRHLMEQAPSSLFSGSDYRDFEYRIITAAGQVKWLSERTILLRDNTGKPYQLQGIVRDITELKGKSLALKKSNERYELMLRATNEAICDWNIEENKAVWDASFQDIFGHDVRQYHNNVWSSNIHPEDQDWVLASMQQTLDDPERELFFMEYRFLRVDRSVAIVQHTGAVLRSSDGHAIRAVGSLKDVTHYKEVLFRIQQQNQKLKEISWIQSHIVRAPLARLIGLAEVLNDDNGGTFNTTELQQHILDAAEELDRIIREIITKTEKIEQD